MAVVEDNVEPKIWNVYEDPSYAQQYVGLDWQGTYYLILRDLPALLERLCSGRIALDFGCGAGRSTQLLHSLGFEATGVDISEAMVSHARQSLPHLEFSVIDDGDFSSLDQRSYDLVMACFPFDNIDGLERKRSLLKGLGDLLSPSGILVNIVSHEQIYSNEWVSFTTAPFAKENLAARSGDIVRTITTDFEGAPVCDDILCDDASYLALYEAADLQVVERLAPLGRLEDPVEWKSELTLAPWVIWALTSARQEHP